MADNETKIRLTAVDGVSAVLNNIKGKTGEVATAFSGLQGAFAALAAIGPIAGLVASVQSAVKTAAAMEELSQKTGIATEKLSALDYAMRREGVSTESFGRAVKELSKNLVEAGDASSNAGKLFAAIGVNVNGGTREALLKIADTFQRLPDGATKAALSVQLFGKAGMDLIPALNNGADGIREIEEEARKLGITFGSESGKQAKQFADQMFAIQESSKALGVAIATIALPQLVEITKTMKIAAETGGALSAVLAGLRESFAALVFGDAIGNKIGDIRKEIAELEKQDKEGPGLLERITGLDQTENIRARIKQLKGELDGLLSFQGAKPSPGAAGPKPDAALQKIIDDFLRKLKGDGKASIDTFGKELEALQLKLEATSSGFSAEFPKALAIFNTALASGRISLEKHAELMGLLIAQQPAFKAAMEAGSKSMERRIELLRQGQEAEVEAINTRDAILDRLEQGNAQLANEIETLGDNAYARERYLLKLEEELDIKQALTPEDETRIRNLYREREALLAAKQAREEQLSVWNEVSDRGARFFADLALSGKDAFKSLKDSLKSFAAEMIALFAKRWILQLGASLTGNTALSALAGNAGQGTLAGTLLSSGGSLLSSGLASIGLGSASQFVGGLTGAIAGPALPGSALAAGQTAGGYLAAAGPYAAAIAAAYALWQTFRDSGENWKGRIGFGSMANAYSTDGVFGREGFQYLAGNDAVNRSIQSFFASTRPLDEQIARRLTSGQIASIQGRLSAYNTSGTRADGQPAEFAFGKGDDTAAAQLSLEYVKQKYGAIFDEIDTDFAAFIRGYTGKAEDLLKAIGDFAAVLDNLDAIGIPGLDLAALKGFQKQGEELGQTFARIAQQFSEYQNLFLTDSEKLSLVQKSVAEGFKELGIGIPKSTEEFKKLVAGLDLSTEEGRKLFEGLMKLAPAFATVANAADQMLSSFDQIARRRNPALGKAILEGELEATVRQFMARNPWTAGMDWRTVAQQLNLITSDERTRSDFRSYSSEDQALILRILGISDDLEGLGSAADDASTALAGIGSGVAAAINSMSEVKMNLWEYLRGLFVDPTLSPLDPSQQLDTLKSRFLTSIEQANSGNIGAAQGLSSLIDQILKLGRENFASGPGYVDLFNWVTGLAGDFVQPGGGMELQRLAYEEQRRQTNLMADVRALLIEIRDRGTADGEAITAAVASVGLSTARR